MFQLTPFDTHTKKKRIIVYRLYLLYSEKSLRKSRYIRNAHHIYMYDYHQTLQHHNTRIFAIINVLFNIQRNNTISFRDLQNLFLHKHILSVICAPQGQVIIKLFITLYVPHTQYFSFGTYTLCFSSGEINLILEEPIHIVKTYLYNMREATFGNETRIHYIFSSFNINFLAKISLVSVLRLRTMKTMFTM